MRNVCDLIDHNTCVGCKACGDVCHKDAISFVADDEGFWQPIVDMNKCVECGLCKKVCPLIEEIPYKEVDPKCYSAWSREGKVRDMSTSGGIFYEIARHILEIGGVVIGARYAEDYKSAYHVMGSDMQSLMPLVGSKYVQSDTQGIYKLVFEQLLQNKIILFSGTPCQCAAMYTFLQGRVNTDNLYMLDFVCNSIYSPFVYKKWLEELEEQEESTLVRNRAKSKKYGWVNRYSEIEFENGKKLYLSDRKGENLYIAGIQYYNLYQRKSCYNCKFREEKHRAADFTVGDFWGIKKQSQYDMFKGISFLMVNSEKGEKLINKISQRLYIKKYELETIKNGNPRMVSNPIINPKREDFFVLLRKKSFSKALYEITGYKIPKKESEWTQFKRIVKTEDISVLKYIYYNYLCKNIIRKGDAKIIPYRNTIIDLEKTSTIIIDGYKNIRIGMNKLKGSKAETYLRMGRDSLMVLSHGADIYYGATIEIKKNAEFRAGFFTMNTGSVMTVDYNVLLGEYVGFGRNNKLYDSDFHAMMTSSGNIINRPQKVTIGDHVWVTSNVTILPGAKIGDNVIVTPNSIVKGSIPSNSCIRDGIIKSFPGWWSEKSNAKYEVYIKDKKIIMVGYGKEGKEFYKKYKDQIIQIIDNSSQDKKTITFKNFLQQNIMIESDMIFVICSSKFFDELYFMVRKEYQYVTIIAGNDL